MIDAHVERLRELVSDGDLATVGQAYNDSCIRAQVTIADVDQLPVSTVQA